MPNRSVMLLSLSFSIIQTWHLCSVCSKPLDLKLLVITLHRKTLPEKRRKYFYELENLYWKNEKIARVENSDGREKCLVGRKRRLLWIIIYSIVQIVQTISNGSRSLLSITRRSPNSAQRFKIYHFPSLLFLSHNNIYDKLLQNNVNNFIETKKI